MEMFVMKSDVVTSGATAQASFADTPSSAPCHGQLWDARPGLLEMQIRLFFSASVWGEPPFLGLIVDIVDYKSLSYTAEGGGGRVWKNETQTTAYKREKPEPDSANWEGGLRVVSNSILPFLWQQNTRYGL